MLQHAATAAQTYSVKTHLLTGVSLILAIFFFAAALLYASVGNAGASSYLAVMAFFGLPHDEMRATALSLNVLVAAIAAYKFYRAGCFDGRLFWPFALSSIPFSFLGGSIVLPGTIYRVTVGLVLLYAAYRLFRRAGADDGNEPQNPVSRWQSLIAGAVMGLIAGLTGVGGGIFLGPLLLFSGWADARRAAGAAAVFNLVNSLAGLAGQFSIMVSLPATIPIWGLAAGMGGWIGAEYGSRRLGSGRLQQILALILVIAGLRLMFP